MSKEKALALARKCGASVTTVQEGQFFQFRDDELAQFYAEARAEGMTDFNAWGPTLTERGPEPSIKHILRHYYHVAHGLSAEKAIKTADAYIAAIKEPQ